MRVRPIKSNTGLKLVTQRRVLGWGFLEVVFCYVACP